ncbi:hypothetical protein Tco_1269065 [Tanacetum coccineum]
MATPFANPERQIWARRDTLPGPIHNIYNESESSESESEDVVEIDIEALTLEQYLTLNNSRGRISNLRMGQTRRIVDSNGLIPGLTISESLKSIQELVDHFHKWHNEERKNTPTPFGIIVEKLKALNHEMDELRVDVRKINTNA